MYFGDVFQDFAAGILSEFRDVRASVIRFSSDVSLEFSLDKYNNIKQINTAINDIKYVSGSE